MIKKLNKIQYLDTVRPDGSGRCNPKRKFQLFVLISIPDSIIYVIVGRAYNLYLSHFSQNGDEGNNLYISYGKSSFLEKTKKKEKKGKKQKKTKKRTKKKQKKNQKRFLCPFLSVWYPIFSKQTQIRTDKNCHGNNI